MNTYINKAWQRRPVRNYECTNVCYARADGSGAESLERMGYWQLTDEEVPGSMIQLYVVGGIRYYGYL